MSRILTVASVAVIPAIVIFQLIAAAEFRASSILIAICGVVATGLMLAEFIQIWRSRRGDSQAESAPALSRAA